MKSIKDIIPVHYDEHNCFEDLIAAVVNWWNGNTFNENIEFCFFDSWNFNYDTNNKNFNNKIDQKFSFNDTSFDSSLKRYYGVEINKNLNVSFDEFFITVEKELSLNKPIIVPAKACYIPWDFNYKNFEVDLIHAFIIVGIDHENKQFIASDAFYGRKNVPISFSNLNNGFTNKFFNFNFSSNYSKLKYESNNCKSTMKNIILNMNESLINKSAFTNMNVFAKDVEKLDDFKEELDTQNIISSNIYNILSRLLQGRKKFSTIFKTLYEVYGIEMFNTISEKLNIAANEWLLIQRMFVKASKIPSFNIIKHRIVDKINDIADYEGNIVDEIMYLNELSEDDVEEYKLKANPLFSHIEYINISSLYNNKSFGDSSKDSKANIISNPRNKRAFILEENIPKAGLFQSHNMKFMFPSIDPDKYDNISCNGQEASFSPILADSIMLLGCAEYGDFISDLTVYYCDNTSEKISIMFTDWAKSPSFGEKIVWKGKCVFENYLGELGEVFANMNSHLYAKTYTLKKMGEINKFKLPNCPNIHIHAISLGTVKNTDN